MYQTVKSSDHIQTRFERFQLSAENPEEDGYLTLRACNNKKLRDYSPLPVPTTSSYVDISTAVCYCLDFLSSLQCLFKTQALSTLMSSLTNKSVPCDYVSVITSFLGVYLKLNMKDQETIANIFSSNCGFDLIENFLTEPQPEKLVIVTLNLIANLGIYHSALFFYRILSSISWDWTLLYLRKKLSILYVCIEFSFSSDSYTGLSPFFMDLFVSDVYRQHLHSLRFSLTRTDF